MIKINDLNYKYKAGNFELHSINLTINNGEFVCIIGKNGSGKSTFSKILAGLTKFKNGSITVNDIDLKKSNNSKTALEIRKNIGIVFQNPETQILFDTVYDDLAFSLQNLGFPKEEFSNRIEQALEKVNMKDFMYSKTDELSLGQKQRIAIAANLAITPKVLILDEPTTMLDPISKTAIYKILKDLQSSGTTIIFITNNIDEILLSDRIIIFENGTIKQDFKKENLLDHFEDLKDFEAPGILSLIKKLSTQNKNLELSDLLDIYTNI
jgi:energy-coupling factor transport system ATP-binding protein